MYSWFYVIDKGFDTLMFCAALMFAYWYFKKIN